MVQRIAAIGFIFLCISVAWLILGQTIHLRTSRQDNKLKDSVGQLWGTVQTQQAPQIYWLDRVTRVEPGPEGESVTRTVDEKHFLNLKASRIEVDLSLEHRRKGLSMVLHLSGPIRRHLHAGQPHRPHPESLLRSAFARAARRVRRYYP